MASNQLLSPTFLFRFSVPCLHRKVIWSENSGSQLDEACRLPSFGAAFGQGPAFADLRAAWNENGLSFWLQVAGKKQPPWCRPDRLEDNDGLHIWIDTRDTHNIHRASRFCHRFAFFPAGGGRSFDQPLEAQMLINRARENASPVPERMLQVRSEKRVDGYRLDCHIPAAALTGFDPNDYTRLGFFYLVQDRELGWQTFSVDNAFPFDEDPSVWGTLELVEEG